MCLKKLFKRKKKEEPVKKKKIDYSKYSAKLNLKALCYYERLTHKSAMMIDTDNLPYLLYSIFIVNNPEMRIDYEAFTMMLENDKKLTLWLFNSYVEQSKIIEQFAGDENNTTDSSGTTKVPMISEIVANLIAVRGIDPHYVMYEMEMWEFETFAKQLEQNTHEHWEEERLWTFFNIMPHIDTKKLKKPEDLIPFPWEKDNKRKKQEEFMAKNKEAIMRTLGLLKDKEEKKEDNNGNDDGVRTDDLQVQS